MKRAFKAVDLIQERALAMLPNFSDLHTASRSVGDRLEAVTTALSDSGLNTFIAPPQGAESLFDFTDNEDRVLKTALRWAISIHKDIQLRRMRLEEDHIVSVIALREALARKSRKDQPPRLDPAGKSRIELRVLGEISALSYLSVSELETRRGKLEAVPPPLPDSMDLLKCLVDGRCRGMRPDEGACVGE